jgi:hypothetical protein
LFLLLSLAIYQRGPSKKSGNLSHNETMLSNVCFLRIQECKKMTSILYVFNQTSRKKYCNSFCFVLL